MSLVDALAKAQAEMQNATFNKINPHFKSRYADLGAIRDAVVPILAKHGIALVQTIETHDGASVVVTRLLKGEEEIVSSGCPIICDKKTPQAFGSALTYARRYSMSALVGIASEEDDDANVAEKSVEDVWVSVLKKGEKTHLKRRAKEMAQELRGCTDQDQLQTYWSSISAELKELKEKLPEEYDGVEETKNIMKNNLTPSEMLYGGQA